MSLGSRINKRNRVIDWLARELAATLDILAMEQDLYYEATDHKRLIEEAYKETK